jgi:hemolysin-activating ACP:hemolysin acyltransferase
MSMDPGLYYDRKGRPIGFMDWARLHEDQDYHVIAPRRPPALR